MSQSNYTSCTQVCKDLDESCPNEECRNWIDYEEDLNCVHIAVEKHGNMTLREVAKRVGCSFVRVKQIEEEALVKLNTNLGSKDYL